MQPIQTSGKRTWRRRFASFVFLMMLISFAVMPAALAATTPAIITLDQAIQLALANDHDVKLAQFAFETAQLNYQRSQASNLLDGTESAKIQAESAFQSAKLTYRQDINKAIIALTDKVFALQYAQLNLRLAQDRLEEAQRNLDITLNHARAGAAQALDELSARVVVADAKASLNSAQAAQRKAEEALRLSLGLPQDAVLPAIHLPDFAAYKPGAQALADAVAASASLTQKQAAVSLAEIELAQKKANGAAPLDLRQAENSLVIAKTQLEKAKADLAANLYSAEVSLQQAADEYAAATVEVELAAQRHSIVQQQSDAGLKTDLDLLADRIKLQQAQSGKLTALRSYQKSLLELKSLLGVSLDPEKGTAPK